MPPTDRGAGGESGGGVGGGGGGGGGVAVAHRGVTGWMRGTVRGRRIGRARPESTAERWRGTRAAAGARPPGVPGSGATKQGAADAAVTSGAEEGGSGVMATTGGCGQSK